MYLSLACHTLSKKENKFLRVFAIYQSSPRLLIKYKETCINERSLVNWFKIS